MRPEAFRTAYPDELQETERRLLRASPERRARASSEQGARSSSGQGAHTSSGDATRGDDVRVGVALSGGGIRSATFALGVFQTLARHGLIRRIDYLSTVSGGGYFGAFLGRLFSRSYVSSAADVERILAPGQAPHRAVDWLRENGRYLAPRGAGDLLLGAAVLLRNWIAIHVALGCLVVAAFLVLRLASIGILNAWPAFRGTDWSPWIALGLVPFWMAVMTGWAYWLNWREEHPRTTAVNFSGIALGLVLLVFALAGRVSLAQPYAALAWFMGLNAAGALVVWAAVRLRARALAARVSPAGARLFRDEEARHRVSAWLKACLLAGAALLTLGVVDSAAAWLYRAFVERPQPWSIGTATLVGLLSGAAAVGRHLFVLLAPRPEGGRPRAPISLLALALALAILFAGACAAATAAHAVAWDFSAPWTRGARLPVDPGTYAVVTLVLLLFALAFGNTFAFLNRSSHQPLYSSRLIRAYLGASNDVRWTERRPVITPIEGDDVEVHEYWPCFPNGDGRSVYEKGAPLHLVNVTINETVDGETQLQQQDRKGVGMALGPAGLSAGIRHHVVFDLAREDAGTAPHARTILQTYPRSGFRMFEYTRPDDPKALWEFPGQPLSLGAWVGISGAAFTTGTGFRTSLGLSLLAGLANVRLGYWWDSRADVGAREQASARRRPLSRLLDALFPVQAFLAREFLARFPGSSLRYWYISDGGHFDNTGAYELIRRRLPLIVLIDAEADPAYRFDGLANLVRKARLDFGADVQFLDRSGYGGAEGAADAEGEGVDSLLGAARGSLDDLRPSGPDRLSLARCALARVTYADEPAAPPRWLLYVKPTLTGDEPLDVRQYAAANPRFPQQTTADQFFDEAQWESYRKLGEHIAEQILGTSRTDRTRAQSASP